MALSRGKFWLFQRSSVFNRDIVESNLISRPATTSPTGSILPEPKKTRFGIVGVICGVIVGLLIGAAISKNVANFLEENELFVPSDDDDDDD
ncbi:essential MCU regulator, mitochondrial [Cephus cinctus]|uniref:Essential MCU regulator, mitochondrial n=1 Tax=Cephus cinctus TaxID=211228 RepID=A0AAJ7C8A5_CEPCN|nr:essential MCU regulator, mitochondrial [Cephus cinctus]